MVLHNNGDIVNIGEELAGSEEFVGIPYPHLLKMKRFMLLRLVL